MSGAIALAACGGSSSSSDTSGSRTKNAALPSPGLNVKALTFKRETLTGWDTHPTGVGLEDQILRDESKHTPCPNGLTTIPSLDAASVQSIVDSCGSSQYLIVHYTGFITVPGTPGNTVSVKFHAIKDNTFSFKVGGVPVIDVWKNSPCAIVEGTINIPAGKAYPIDSWFMNFNSGYCNELSWSLDGGAMVVVPASAFTRTGDASASLITVPPTATIAPTTTVKAATTTLATPTSVKATTTTIASETTVKKQVVVTTTVKATTTTVADQTVSGNAMNATTTTTVPSSNASSASTSTAPDEAVATESSDSTMVTSDSVATTDSTVASTEITSDTTGNSDGSSSNVIVLIVLAIIAILGVWTVAFRKKKKS